MRQVSPKLQPWLNEFNQQLTLLIEKGFKPTPVNAREGLANLTRGLVNDIPDIALIRDDVVACDDFDVPIRIYHPDPENQLPVLVYYHGGGHMAGSVSVYDPLCRKIALATKHVVVSVEYRLAPECRYPAGLDDAYNVLKQLWPTLDQNRLNYRRQLSIGGDSAGGALVASISRSAQFDIGLHIYRQVLVYPCVDYTMSFPSIEENGEGYLLQSNKVAWYFENYFRHDQNRYEASPLFGEITAAIPESLVITAEFCPLRDEGVAYVEKLRSAGVKVQHLHFDDMIHTFLNMEDLVKTECGQVYTAMNTFLND